MYMKRSKVLTEGKMKGGNGSIKKLSNSNPPSSPPPPPTPPEIRRQCSSCGFTAPKSEYEKKHQYCISDRLLLGATAIIGISFIVMIVLKFFQYV